MLTSAMKSELLASMATMMPMPGSVLVTADASR